MDRKRGVSGNYKNVPAGNGLDYRHWCECACRRKYKREWMRRARIMMRLATALREIEDLVV